MTPKVNTAYMCMRQATYFYWKNNNHSSAC